MIYVGIDVGGTGIQVGLVDESGKILCKGGIVTRTDIPFDMQVKAMADCVLDTIDKGGYTLGDVKAIGAGVPGVTDPRTGNIAFCTNLGWVDVPFVQEFNKHIAKPVFVGNDATVAGLAESVAGVSAGSDSSVFVTLGTGVGGGVVLDGKMLTGYTGAASELGHMVIRAGGEECTCGRRGCFEAYASATALIRETKRAMAAHPESRMHAAAEENGAVDGRTAFIAAQRGDAAAQAVVDRYLDDLACGVANIVNIFFPEVIALSGGVANQGDALLVPLRERVRALSYGSRYAVRHTRIELCTLGYRAGVIGAALLAKQS